MNAVSDSDVVIDWLQGVAAAATVFAEYDRISISRITWIEALVGASTPEKTAAAIAAFRAFDVIAISEQVARLAVQNRQVRRLKLPDAIVLATAQSRGEVLLTRNTRDFSDSDPLVRIPYRL